MKKINERGFFLLSFAIFLSAFIAATIYYSTISSEQTIHRLSISLRLSYANTLSTKFAQKIRWSYDIAKVVQLDPVHNAALCPATQGAQLVTLPGSALKLCLVGTSICVPHPRSGNNVCIATTDGTLLAKVSRPSIESIASHLLIPRSQAQSDMPPAPDLTEMTNSLTVGPTCVGGNCTAICGVDADCLSFKFCPLDGGCNANEVIWQTVGLLR